MMCTRHLVTPDWVNVNFRMNGIDLNQPSLPAILKRIKYRFPDTSLRESQYECSKYPLKLPSDQVIPIK